MPANECTPFFETGRFTAQATAGITGKRFLVPSGNRTSGPGLATTSEGSNYRVAHAAANGPTCGVSTYDAASGAKVGVEGQPGSIVPVTADGAITAGDLVMVGATGKAKTYAPPTTTTATALPVVVVVGIAMTGAADGADAEIKLI